MRFPSSVFLFLKLNMCNCMKVLGAFHHTDPPALLEQQLDRALLEARDAKEGVPLNGTPSKVLRSGKRVPPSTAKKPKGLRRIQDEMLEQVRRSRQQFLTFYLLCLQLD